MTSEAQAAVVVNQELSALGNERFEADGATFIRNLRFPEWRDANHVTYVTASTPQEIRRLLDRVEAEFDGFPHRQFDLGPDTHPALQATLVLEGYSRDDDIVMLLRGDLRGAARPADIHPVEDDSDWDALAGLVELDWREYRERTGDPLIVQRGSGKAHAANRRRCGSGWHTSMGPAGIPFFLGRSERCRAGRRPFHPSRIPPPRAGHRSHPSRRSR